MSEKNARKARKSQTAEKKREALFRAFAIFRKRDVAELRAAWEAGNPAERRMMERTMRQLLDKNAKEVVLSGIPIIDKGEVPLIVRPGARLEVGEPGYKRQYADRRHVSLREHFESKKFGPPTTAPELPGDRK